MNDAQRPLPEKLGKYEVRREVGRGGVGAEDAQPMLPVADRIAAGQLNVLALPGVAAYPVTITLIKSASPITLANGTFNFALGTLPTASPAYAGSLTESANSQLSA